MAEMVHAQYLFQVKRQKSKTGVSCRGGLRYRLVHEKIGLKIARRLGVKSLRETMVLDSSESFGVPFGQKECLTRRLSNILEQYPQGITPFLEFIQNADDAGARNVKIVRAIRNSQHKFI